MPASYIEKEMNKRQSKEKFYLFGATICINLLVLLGCYYTQSFEYLTNALLMSTIYMLIVVLQYYFICPLQLKMVSVLFFWR